MAISIIGYPAIDINYCPSCGSTSNFEYDEVWNSDAKLKCKCGCSVTIIANDDHLESEGIKLFLKSYKKL